MPMTKKMLRNFDAYLERFPKNVQRILQKMRLTIKKAAPQAKETISYGIPAFTLNGLLVWFAAHKNHIGFYRELQQSLRSRRVISLQRSERVGAIPLRQASSPGSH